MKDLDDLERLATVIRQQNRIDEVEANERRCFSSLVAGPFRLTALDSNSTAKELLAIAP